MNKHTATLKDLRYYLSAWGNENYIRNYIAYFEKKASKEAAESKKIKGIDPISCSPNYAAWIRFYAEFICNSLYWKLFRYEGDWESIQKLSYKEVRNNILKRIKKEIELRDDKLSERDLGKISDAASLILNLRHSFQHGGTPNIMRKVKNVRYKENIRDMLKPRNFANTKETFVKAAQLFKLLPQPTIAF